MGVTLRKGEELGYFQFGGSDVIVMFEAKPNVRLDAVVGRHYRMGVQIGEAQEMSTLVRREPPEQSIWQTTEVRIE